MSWDVIWLVYIASLAAGLVTGAGALLVLLIKKISDKSPDTQLGFPVGLSMASSSTVWFYTTPTTNKVLLKGKQMLKPQGTLENLGWKNKPMKPCPPEHIRFSQDEASSHIKHSDFKIKKMKETSPHHYIITAHNTTEI